MPTVIQEAEIPDENDLVGLEDGGKILLECSNCKEPLVEIWKTKNYLDFTMKYKALCPHCGDHSFVKEIHGGIHAGAIGKTAWTHFEIEDDVVVYHTVKSEVNNEDV